jgi:hypothetical protein
MEAMKKFSPAIFVIIIICFFLPFVNLSCAGQTVMSLTGFQLITGAEYKPEGMFNQPDLFNQQGMENTEIKEQNVEAQPMALLAIIAAAAGLLFSIFRRNFTTLICSFISLAGALFLLLLKITIDSDASSSGEGIIVVEYQFAYWFSFLLFIAGIIVHWLLYKESKSYKAISEQPAQFNG